jgi:PAS domain S-box-containing protein
MKIDLKLWHKGLILVILPLSFELLFVVTLAGLLGQAESDIARETRAREIMACVNAINTSFTDAGDAATGFSISRAALFVQAFEDAVNVAKEELSKLRQLTADDKKEALIVSQSDAIANDLISHLSKGVKLLEGDSELEGMGEIEGWKQRRDDFKTEAHKIFLEQQAIVSKSPAARAQNRNRVTEALWGGVALNVLIAIALAVYFNKGTAARLDILLGNTERLGNKQALSAPIDGTDEIAKLDHTFHKMAALLAEAARRERAIVDNAMDVICSIGSNGAFTQVSPASTKVWGYTPEELIGTKYRDIVVSDDRGSGLDAARKSLHGLPIELRLRRKDDSIIHVLWSTYWSPTEEALFCVAHDITERKRAEELLRASEERIRQIIDSMPVGLMIVNDDGIIEMTNPAVTEMFGYDARKLPGKHMMMLFHDPKEDTRVEFMNVLFREAVGRITERETERINAEVFSVELSLKSFMAREGRRFLVIMLDITQRRELERLKQEFVAMVSHDLRTPLTSIQAFLTLLGESVYGELTEQGLKKTKAAEQSSMRLISLINDLLDMEKLESGKFQMEFSDIPVYDVIDRSVDSVRAFAEQRGVVIDADDTNLEVHADGDRLVQVLVNLLSNAVKYSPKDCPVKVSARELEDKVEIRVTDAGRGIPAHMKEAVFERFKQVEVKDAKEKGGSGLGLAISKAMIEQHGGAIGVDSEEGKGSSFWFTVPQSRASRAKS